MNSPLITRNLTKRFNDRPALKSLTLEIPAGRVIGLLGRNGAGKSTLLNLACGLLLPTDGSCITLGRDCAKLDTLELARLGVVFQEGRYVDWMTVRQHLEFTASFYPRWDRKREQRLLEALELDPGRKIIQLSLGDQQKIGVILGVCHHPALLLLDEPMSALDPIARSQLLGFLVDFVREDGCTILISSHLLADVEKIIDWAVFLDRGELALTAAFDELQETYSEWFVTSTSRALPPRFAEPSLAGRRYASGEIAGAYAGRNRGAAVHGNPRCHDRTPTVKSGAAFPHASAREEACCMTANIHVPLLRMGRVVLFALMWASCLAVLFLLPPSVAHREGTKAFLGFGMLLPLVFGLPLAAVPAPI